MLKVRWPHSSRSDKLDQRKDRAPKSIPLREKIGICQWFHYEDFAAVDRAVELLNELKVKHFRTGISWADYFRPRGRAWYDWQMRRLRESGLEILLSVWH